MLRQEKYRAAFSHEKKTEYSSGVCPDSYRIILSSLIN